MARAERYVLLDNVQFKKNNWQNRNKIVDQAGQVQWLTVPVLIDGHTGSTINDMHIQQNTVWKRKYLGRIREAYRRHRFFNAYVGEIECIINEPFERLVDLNLALIRFFRAALGIQTEMVRASTLLAEGRSTDLLVAICRSLGGSTYISGPDGRSYLDLPAFDRAGIKVEFHQFSPPVYDAPHYQPGLSTLDVLMNCGAESRRVIGL